MIGRTGKYKSRESIEDLPCLSLSSIRKATRKEKYRLSKVIAGFDTGHTKEASGKMEFTSKKYGRTTKLGNIGYFFEKDTEGVYIRLEYKYSPDQKTEYRPVSLKYYLVARESNLKPGTYRYYFLDPYSEKEGGLCTKLYLYEGVFYPLSVLRCYGVLYRQQKQGHTRRYVDTFAGRVPDKWRKYGKTHYRGRITPGYERYCYIREEADRRWEAEILYKYPGMLAEYYNIPTPEERGETPISPELGSKEERVRKIVRSTSGL